MAKRKRRAGEDEFWEGPPSFVPAGPPAPYRVPASKSGVIGFHGKPKPVRAKGKAKSKRRK